MMCVKRNTREEDIKEHGNKNLRENMQKHSAGEKMKKNRLITLMKKRAGTKRALEF
jgi:hypothetical protein